MRSRTSAPARGIPLYIDSVYIRAARRDVPAAHSDGRADAAVNNSCVRPRPMDLPNAKFKLFFIISVKSLINYVSNVKIEASNRLYFIETPRFTVSTDNV